jgi:6-phosphogluconolactonase
VSKPEILIQRDLGELAHKAAEQFIALAGAAVARSGRFAVALSGGSTPRALYQLLGSAKYRERLDWRRVHLFWGDERCVPPDHAESNFRMARESWLSKIQMPAANIHRMEGEKEPYAAAEAYEQELQQFFAPAPGQLPRFDLILLGIGEDGHTASLFPGSAALDENERMVAALYVDKLRAYRLTLTLPVINAGAQVMFLVSGANKANALGEILASGPCPYPAAKVRPCDGQLTWLIDQAAAQNLPANI